MNVPIAGITPTLSRSYDQVSFGLPDTIYHVLDLIEWAEENDAVILICGTTDQVDQMIKFGIPALATHSGRWAEADCLPIRQAGLERNLCLYSDDKGWIHETAMALGKSFTADRVMTFACSGEANLTSVYNRINNPANYPPLYDWQEEEERLRNRLFPAPVDLSRDVASIPRTDFLYGTHYIRREVGVTVAAAGTGKSFLALTECLAMASERNLLGIKPEKTLSVWYWTEDQRDDGEIRLRAAMQFHGVCENEIGGRIRISSFRDNKLKLATLDGCLRVDRALVTEIAETCRDENVDVIVFDTLKKLHGLNENSNPEMDALYDELIYIAEVGNCAVETVHHMGKPGDRPQGMNSARGASAILGSVRAGRFLCRMTAEEGEKAGVDNHKAYFSVESGKFNKSAEDSTRRWLRLSGRDMANGDNIGQLEAWRWPDAFGDMTKDDTNAILEALATTPRRASDQSTDWAGHLVAAHLGLNMDDKHARSKVKTMLKTWLSNGVIRTVQMDDAKRTKRPHYEVTGKHRV